VEDLFSKGITEICPINRGLSFQDESSSMVKDFVTRFEAAERALHLILEAGPELIESLPAPERLIAREIRKQMEEGE